MIRVCRKEGNNNPDLWVQVLGYLVNNALSGDPEQSSPPPNNNDGDGKPTSLPAATAAAAASSSGEKDDGGDASSEDEGDGGSVGGEGRWDDVRELLALIERDQVLSPLRVSEQRAREGERNLMVLLLFALFVRGTDVINRWTDPLQEEVTRSNAVFVKNYDGKRQDTPLFIHPIPYPICMIFITSHIPSHFQLNRFIQSRCAFSPSYPAIRPIPSHINRFRSIPFHLSGHPIPSSTCDNVPCRPACAMMPPLTPCHTRRHRHRW